MDNKLRDPYFYISSLTVIVKQIHAVLYNQVPFKFYKDILISRVQRKGRNERNAGQESHENPEEERTSTGEERRG